MNLKAKLVEQALREGFVAARVCRPWDVPEVPARLSAFVEAGYHGQMGWMADRMHWRGNPAALWPEARSVIMLAESYAPTHDPLAVLQKPDKGAISVYAQGRDYHDVVKKRLKRLARWLIDQAPCEVKVFVDTAPVPEKALAQAAGKFMGVLVKTLGGGPNADQAQQFDGFAPGFGAANVAVQVQHLGDMTTHGKGRVQAGHRLLKDHADAIAAYAAHGRRIESQQVVAVEENTSAVDLRRR